jgi:hypothetical protein
MSDSSNKDSIGELYTVIYLSSATELFSDDELKNLGVGSTHRNESVGITGVLLYNEGNFIQCLEGPKKHVLATYDRISSNPRHKGIMKIVGKSITERSFSKWAMGVAKAKTDTFLNLSEAISRSIEPNSSSSLVAVSMLKSFIEVSGEETMI